MKDVTLMDVKIKYRLHISLSSVSWFYSAPMQPPNPQSPCFHLTTKPFLPPNPQSLLACHFHLPSPHSLLFHFHCFTFLLCLCLLFYSSLAGISSPHTVNQSQFSLSIMAPPARFLPNLLWPTSLLGKNSPSHLVFSTLHSVLFSVARSKHHLRLLFVLLLKPLSFFLNIQKKLAIVSKGETGSLQQHILEIKVYIYDRMSENEMKLLYLCV